jgi:HEAT repeat protein
MDEAPSRSLLHQFLADGQAASLLAYVRQAHPGDRGFEAAAQAIAAVLQPLGLGEQPAYQRLDTALLLQHRTATQLMLILMLGSPKADLQECAVRLMGQLAWPEFLAQLEPLLGSGQPWQRIAALRALTRVQTPRALELLQHATQDMVAEVSAEAHRLLRAPGGTKAAP